MARVENGTVVWPDEVDIAPETLYDVYAIGGKIAVDKVCRFENLSEELETIRMQLGIPEKLDFPRAKSGYRKDKRSYREILNEGEREKVAELFRDEIKLLGYEF